MMNGELWMVKWKNGWLDGGYDDYPNTDYVITLTTEKIGQTITAVAYSAKAATGFTIESSSNFTGNIDWITRSLTNL